MGGTLLDAMPDLVVALQRDGRILAHAGGHEVPDLRPGGPGTVPAWSDATAALIRQLLRRSLTHRLPMEARFQERGCEYEARVTPQGPDRAMCTVRRVLAGARDQSADSTADIPRPELDRRGFLRRLRESLSVAALREQTLSVAVIRVDGVADIDAAFGGKVAEQVLGTAILRLSVLAQETVPPWYLGQLGEHLLAMVISGSSRESVESCVAAVCSSLREPIAVAGARFTLKPFAGVGVLGQDSRSPQALLDYARAAAMEARRDASNSVRFYSDTMKLQSLSRLDLASELREAISQREIGFRYLGRHDLTTGHCVAQVGYLQWRHPLRGELAAADFIRIAESTGLGVSLSRAGLAQVCTDIHARGGEWPAEQRISFGPLRDHVFNSEFLADIESALADQIPAERLELRISEEVFSARDPGDFHTLQRRGVQLVVDELGRGVSSLVRLSRAPIDGLILDRAWVTGVSTDEVARRVCRVGVNIACALGLTAIANGIDDPVSRDAMLEVGCHQGSGDLYGAAAI
jgi:predicted signal transduction protein with EAL and GGDEF domain